MRKNLLLILFILPLGLLSVSAQNFTDGLMMPKGDLCTGFLYNHDQWKNYWEGTLKRDNHNIGMITTQNIMWMGNYGVSDKINIIAMLPYVKTKASEGVLAGDEGIQDLTIGAKYIFFKKTIGSGEFNSFVLGSYSVPLTNYTPDFLPLSIGMGAQQLSGRITLNYKMEQGWYANATSAYTWRSNVTLDRYSYYTDGQLFYGNEVEMPNVIDFSFSAGYHKNSLNIFLSYTQQNTLGGGDIRRQDMPFVSNQMNFSKVDATIMYYVPKPKGLAIRSFIGQTISGRNVGQSTYFMGGLLYTIHFAKTTN
jgi:hypothetical protein